MKLNFVSLLGAALLCGSLAVNAQSQGAGTAGGAGKEMHERMKQAREACKEKPDRHACMTESMCAKAPDPAKCQAQAKERMAKMSKHMDERQAIAEACTGKRGEELQKCYREQREKSGHGRHDKKG